MWILNNLASEFWEQLGWWKIAAGVAVGSLVVLFVSTILGKLKDHTGKLMMVCTITMMAAWWTFPRTKEVEKVVYKEPGRPIVIPPLPTINFPKIPPITIKWPEPRREKFDSEAAEKARLAELERQKKLKAKQDAERKRWAIAEQKRQNALIWAQIDAWMAQEWWWIMNEYEREQYIRQWQINQGWQPIYIKPPVVIRRR